jgi:hypothetical protein
VGVGDYNWDAWQHSDLYNMIHNAHTAPLENGFHKVINTDQGKGVSGTQASNDAWQGFVTLMTQAQADTETAINKAHGQWSGGAADSMHSGISPLAQWAQDAQTAGAASQSSVGDQTSSYVRAKDSMPEPVPVSSTDNADFLGIPAGFTHLVGGQTDQDKQEAGARAAKDHAVDVMTTYQSSSQFNANTLGTFQPPPSVTVAAADPAIIEHPVKSWPGTVDPGHNTTGKQGKDGRTSSVDPGRGGITPPPGPGGHPGVTPPPGTSGSTTAAGWSAPTVPAGGAPSIGTGPSYGQTPYGSGPTSGLGGLGTGEYGVSPYGPGGSAGVTGGGAGGAGSGGSGRSGSGVRGGGTPGTESGGRGTAGRPSGAGIPGEGGAAGRGGARAGGAGAQGRGGMGGMGQGAHGQGDEDEEHFSADYLKGSNDSFWETDMKTAPPVIGE